MARSTFDAQFEEERLPAIYNAVKVVADHKGVKLDLTGEVQQHLGGGRVRCVALGSTDGLVRGHDCVDTGAPLSVPVGEKTLGQSLRCVRPGGTLSMIGVLSGGAMSAPLGLVVTRQVRLQGITVGHRDGMEAMVRAISQHGLKPVIDKVFAFAELKEAMAHLKSGAHFGKICIQH